jgi:hypothetical protein
VCDENEDEWIKPIFDTIHFRYQVRAEVRRIRSVYDVGRLARDGTRFTCFRVMRRRPLLKDPIAFFSAPWLAKRFGVAVIVLIRHPAAFASSLKRLNWQFDFSNLSSQPLLTRDLLHPWESQIRDFSRRPRDIVDQAALLWTMIYGVADVFMRKHKDWIFVRHEDLSMDPVGGFRELFEAANLAYSPRIERAVRSSTGQRNPAEAPAGVIHALQRDSRAAIVNWKQRLNSHEVARLRAGVEAVAPLFYSETSW